MTNQAARFVASRDRQSHRFRLTQRRRRHAGDTAGGTRGARGAGTAAQARRPSTQPNAAFLFAECAAMNHNHFTGREVCRTPTPDAQANFDHVHEEGLMPGVAQTVPNSRPRQNYDLKERWSYTAVAPAIAAPAVVRHRFLGGIAWRTSRSAPMAVSRGVPKRAARSIFALGGLTNKLAAALRGAVQHRPGSQF